MKRIFFTFLLCSAVGFTYANKSTVAPDPMVFGPNDVLIANFEVGGVNPLITDSLWTDTLKTTPNPIATGDLILNENPLLEVNTSPSVSHYYRPAGGWRSLYIRLDKKIDYSKTPYFQFMINPVSGLSPAKGTKVEIWLKNDKDLVPATQIAARWGDVPTDKWTVVTSFLGRNKTQDKYNVLEIQINNGDSTANAGTTEYYIDQIGFKAPADGVALKSTIFYENFGGWKGGWHDGKIYRQIGGGSGYIAQYDSLGGFATSGIHFTCKDVAADTASIFQTTEWGISFGAAYEGASGGSRMYLSPQYHSTIEAGPIDVRKFRNLEFGFGFATQQWWNDGNIVNARPKIELSVDGGEFFEIYEINPDKDFPLAVYDTIRSKIDGTDSIINTKYQDRLFKWVNYPLTEIDGSPLRPSVNSVNIRMSHGAGPSSFVDDLWLAGTKPSLCNCTGIINPNSKSEAFSVYPNPASKYILTPNAQTVSILDLNGRIVKEAINSEKVDVSSLAKGAYIVKVKVNNTTKIGKLIKT